MADDVPSPGSGSAGGGPQVTLAVLTGGLSRRMGRDKATMPVAGGPLGGLPVQALGDLAAEILLAGAPVPGIAARTVPDGLPRAGPLAGLVAALEAARTPLVIVVACDMPSVQPPLVALLIERLAGEPDLLGALCAGDAGLEPFPSVWRREAAAALRPRLVGGVRAVRDAVADLPLALVQGADWRRVDRDGLSFVNWNRPQDVDASTLA